MVAPRRAPRSASIRSRGVRRAAGRRLVRPRRLLGGRAPRRGRAAPPAGGPSGRRRRRYVASKRARRDSNAARRRARPRRRAAVRRRRAPHSTANSSPRSGRSCRRPQHRAQARADRAQQLVAAWGRAIGEHLRWVESRIGASPRPRRGARDRAMRRSSERAVGGRERIVQGVGARRCRACPRGAVEHVGTARRSRVLGAEDARAREWTVR